MSSEKTIESLAADARFAALEQKCAHMETRSRIRWTFATIALLGGFLLGANKESIAQGYGVTLAQLLNRVVALETKTASMSTLTDPNTQQPTVRFEGVNLQVVNGTGTTDGEVNGVGNLIIGYNELREETSDIRSGSHNLILGAQNSYSSFGGMVVGVDNTISGEFATISAGLNNKATGNFASVSGGQFNTSSGSQSSITGGQQNVASAGSSSVSGGLAHTSNAVFNWRAGTLFQAQ